MLCVVQWTNLNIGKTTVCKPKRMWVKHSFVVTSSIWKFFFSPDIWTFRHVRQLRASAFFLNHHLIPFDFSITDQRVINLIIDGIEHTYKLQLHQWTQHFRHYFFSFGLLAISYSEMLYAIHPKLDDKCKAVCACIDFIR